MAGATNWTQSQLDAIEARGGSVLVSAAAGSGKTTVLVERIIRRIKSGELNVNELLVVTFTNAAAANMKTKISKALTKAIREASEAGSGDISNLRRQQIMLPLSKISTIDSFCISLVRENFQLLGISPDFALIDESRQAILTNEAVSLVFDRYYEENPKGFAELCNTVCTSRDDSALEQAVLKVYAESQAYPFPDEYLDSLSALYAEKMPFEETVWGRQIYSYIEKALDYAIHLYDRAISLSDASDEMRAKRSEFLRSEKEMYVSLLDAVKNKEPWDSLREKFASVSFDTIPRVGKNAENSGLCTSLRTAAKEVITKDINANIFICSQDEIYSDTEKLYPVIKCLTSMVRDFTLKYSELKLRENAADFSDTLHLAIKLLCARDENGNIIKDENGEPVPGSIAKELSEQFAEILIDEYQDVNKAQDIIFSLISRGNSNLFMVGDVKQSIYGFRQAMPEIFLSKQKNYVKYDGENYPATIVLGTNFRSRPGITGNINHIFSRLMTEGIGGLEYNEDHYLHHQECEFAPKSSPDVEFHIVNSGNTEAEEGQETVKTDAQDDEVNYIADYITNNVGRLMVKDGDGERPARYGDFAVLMHSVKDVGVKLLAELQRRHVPALCRSETRFFESAEVRLMTALMRVINNPVDDVSLLAVMLSPVYGFTADEIAEIKVGRKHSKLYRCAVYAAENGNAKCKSFLDELNRLRKLSFTMGAGEYIQLLLDETGYYSIVSSMNNADARLFNLRTLAGYASSYESIGRTGLPGFLRYLEKAEKTGADVKVSNPVSDSADAVRIMTIHSSKGLEFPICILSRCFKQFNTDSGGILLSRSCGIGMNSGGERFVSYQTMQSLACGLEKKEAERAESLRVLYVALTRAMEKLVIVATNNVRPRSQTKIKIGDISDSAAVMPYQVMKCRSYSDFLVSALINHIDSYLLRETAGAENVTTVKGDEMRVIAAEPQIYEETEEEKAVDEEEKQRILAEIKQKLSFEYGYACLEGKAAKKVASDFALAHSNDDFIASAKPAFMCRDDLTPAQRGTATHRFMQFCTFDGTDVNTQLERMVNEGSLTKQQADAVEMGLVEKFFRSPLYKRIVSADKIYREKSFTCALRAGDVYADLDGDAAEETIIVDGTADIAIEENGELTVIDYKTDRKVTEAKLRELYTGQLEIYRRCLAETLGKNVKETLIYSFSLGKTVEI